MKKFLFILAAALMVLVAASCEKTKTKSSNSSNPQPFAPKSLDDLTGTVWFSDNGSSQLILHFKGRSSSEQEDYPYYLSYYQLTSDDRIRTQYTCGVTKLKEGSVFFITNKMELAPSGAVNSTFSYEGRLDGEKMELYQAGTSTGLIFELRRDLDPSTLKYVNVPQAVDLGEMTPSYSSPIHILWASQNLGAADETGYGLFYAWGELDPKLSYHEDNYMYQDNPKVLPADRDAASVRLGDGWRMPTHSEVTALLNAIEDQTNFSCTFETKGSGSNTLNGWRIKRLTGEQAGNSIFIPMPGFINGSENLYENKISTGATSTAFSGSDGTLGAYRMELGYPGISGNRICIVPRFQGLPIRPVKDI